MRWGSGKGKGVWIESCGEKLKYAGKNREKVRRKRDCLEKDERCGVERKKSVEWSMRENGFGGWGDGRRGRRSDALVTH